MEIFKNLFFIFLVIGVISRIFDQLLFKYTKLKRKTSIHISMLITIAITAPLVAIFVGFDVLISSYLMAALSWLFIDLLYFKNK
jgi:hypothetical protein